ncbi:uncharacterized protein EI90DRAFT_139758 [Cantharellus anzutake]|uniref:uncharacterized protein n=1 Tax=Cantharellus anzutake TaxID=1750568 RepID=UPI0019059F9B|nr:uncharacterized protein EI90DRAFT_139758 [Cantharellus anzutake]KAF8317755.1 hypothetical protein EI90DRAFT_139758 [Cantharellus anzutake]
MAITQCAIDFSVEAKELCRMIELKIQTPKPTFNTIVRTVPNVILNAPLESIRMSLPSSPRPSSRTSRIPVSTPTAELPSRNHNTFGVEAPTSPRPVSIIDDALSDGRTSPILFDRRRSSAALAALAGENSLLPLPTVLENDKGSISPVSSRNGAFNGKESPTRSMSRS